MLIKLQKMIYSGFLILFPVFCLSYFVNPFDLPKIFLLTAVVGILLFCLGLEIAIKGKLSLKVSGLDLSLFLLALAYTLSGIFVTPNKMEAFFFPGNAAVMILGFLVYFLGKRIFEGKKEEILTPLFFSGLLVSLLSILGFLGVFALIPQLPQFLKDTYFSSVGGKLPEVILLVSILPLGVGALIKEKEILKKILYGLSILIIVIAATLNISFILPGKPTAPVIASMGESWTVATKSLKQSPILGIGPGNYLSAYSKFVPLSHNSTPFWSIRFSSASNFLLTLATETGILGLAAFVSILFFLTQIFISKYKDPEAISVFILTISFFVFPGSLVLTTLFFLLLVNISKGKLVDLKLPKLTSSLVFFVSILLFFLSYKVALGEVNFKSAIDAISKNDGRTSYNTLRSVITTNPYVDRYHATYSQVNLALAKNLSEKANITEEEKETVAQLIQQAIREAKATVTLNPQRAGNWELLARTYQAVMPFAQGADEFAIQTFNQAITLDPINPTLRTGLGGTYFALGRYDDAIATFGLALAAKMDLPNTHYNLAIAYKEKGDIKKAEEELNIVLSLVAIDSSDYQTATNELKNLETTSKESKKSETPTIELPEEAAPPTQ